MPLSPFGELPAGVQADDLRAVTTTADEPARVLTDDGRRLEVGATALGQLAGVRAGQRLLALVAGEQVVWVGWSQPSLTVHDSRR